MGPRPNLFDYATSELSQDAVLIWLAEFADPQHRASDPLLHQLGQSFVRSLLARADVAVDEIRSIRTSRQLGHIDITIVVNDEVGLLIEDKTETRDHDDQLRRYRSPAVAARLKVSFDRLRGIYLKTGNEASRDEWPEGWRPYTRADLLAAIGLSTDSGSDIARDFIEHLRQIDRDTEAFRSGGFLISDAKWDNPRGIEGFYQWLGAQVPGTDTAWWDWRYVANATGGFYGFWTGADWVLPEMPQFDFYLQIHDGHAAFVRMSLRGGGRVEVVDLRNALEIIQRVRPQSEVSWRKPRRHNAGESASVAQLWVGGDQHFAKYTAKGKFDETGTADRLRLVWQDLTALSCGQRTSRTPGRSRSADPGQHMHPELPATSAQLGPTFQRPPLV
jgi:hypothetical protein